MKELSGNFNIRGTPATSTQIDRSSSTKGISGGPSFRDQLNALNTNVRSAGSTTSASPLKFSNHAVERMQSRGLRFSPEDLARIESAVGKAAQKGSRDTLLITDQAALIVSVKDNTVVTVMDKASLKENVFTNIDSTVMI